MFKAASRRRALEPFHASREAPARVGSRTKLLVRRVNRGDAAVIRHTDLDSVAAASLIDRQPAFVVNASDSLSGRYPNGGPALLLRAGIPLLDCLGDDAFAEICDGDLLRLEGNRLVINERRVVHGRRVSTELVDERMQAARANMGAEIRTFAENTLSHLAHEAADLLEPTHVPSLKVPIAHRHAVVVVRGEGYRDDLARLRPYIQERRPVLIAVDGSADTLLELGLAPHVIFGDMDSVTDEALRSGAELVVHAYPDGRAPGIARLKSLGLTGELFPIPGTSEDAAMLMAYEHGAEVIVAVGTHFSLVDFLDKGRAGMASTFLVRLKVGSILVDAKGVSRLYRPGVPARYLVALALTAALPIVAIFSLSPKLSLWLQLAAMRLQFLFHHSL